MLPSEGPDSATHNLCAGSVKTPMLGLLSEVVGLSETVAIPALFCWRERLADEVRAIGGREGDRVCFSLTSVEGDVLFAVEVRASGAPVAAQLELWVCAGQI